MLDVETKNRINTARDILVGKVPDPKSQVEQITIALIYKFMDDMDVESEELGGKRTFFVGEYAKYAWRKIFDPRQSGYELLNLYSEAITKMDTNPGVPKLFRDIFKNAYLPYRDPETLKSFLKIINDFEYSHSEKLGDAFEFLLSILGSQGDAGQFRTPRHIIDFMVAIIDPKKHEVILDPACGTAGFLISSYKHIIKQNSSNFLPEQNTSITGKGTQSVNEVIITTNGYSGDKLTADERKMLADNIHGYDISPDMVRLSLVNMYLHGIKEPHISEYDTLTSEDHWNQYCDVILANPPFMSPKGGIRPHKRFSVQSNRSEVLFVDYIAEHLTPDGRAVVIVPEGIIFQSGTAYKNLRKMLVEKYLVGVISLPAGVFQPYSGVKTSILWLDKTLAKKTDQILYIKIENDGFDLGAQRRAIKNNDLPRAFKLISSYRNQINTGKRVDLESEQNIFLISKNEISGNGDFNLTGDRYRKPEIGKNAVFPLVKIGDLCSFDYGKPLKQEDRIPGDYPVFGSNGIVGYHNSFLVEAPFIVVGRKGSAGEVHFSERNGFPIDTTFYIKLNNENRIKLKFLFLVLMSIDLKNVNVQAGVPGLNRNDAYVIPVPLPPLSIQEEIIAEVENYQKIIDGARQVVENYKPRIDIDPEWEMVEMGEVCELIGGGTPSRQMESYWKDGTIKWISSKHINNDGSVVGYELISNDGLKNSSSKIVPKGSTIVITRVSVGKIAHADDDYAVNQDLTGLRVKDPNVLNEKFLFYSTRGLSSVIDHNAQGLGVRGINREFLASLKIPLPDKNVQDAIVLSIEKENDMVNSAKGLITSFEQKIKDRIAKVWGSR
jgi:type I restriction enzyme M protein